MKKLLLMAGLLTAVLLTTPVLASVLTDARYESDVAVVNTGAATTAVSVPFSLSTASLIANNFIEADCTDTCMQISGTDVAFMPAPGDTSNWIVFVPAIDTTTLTAKLYLGGGTDMVSKLRYFPAASGMSVAPDVSLPWATSGAFEIKGYFDLTAGANKDFLKITDGGNTHKIYVSALNEIKANWSLGGITLTAAGLTSGEHTLKVELIGGTYYLYWDSILKDSIAYAGAINLGAAETWYYAANDCMVYVEYVKMWKSAAVSLNVGWNYDTAAPYVFLDSSGNANDATATLRTTTSDVDVSASIVSMIPISESEAVGYSVTGGIDIISDVPDAVPNIYDEGETGGMVVDEVINEAIAAADIPEAIVWYPIAFGTAIALGFAAYGKTKSIIVQAVVSGVVMAAFCGGGVLGDGLLPYWTVLIFGIEAVFMIIISERQHS